MKSLENAIIAPEKLTQYLLIPKKHNDKSKWLAQAGYILENWEVLRDDLKQQVLSKDRLPKRKTDYGQLYEITGILTGPNGVKLSVCTVWMVELETKQCKFITMHPNKKESKDDV